MTIYASIIGSMVHYFRTDKASEARKHFENRKMARLAQGWIPTSKGIEREYDVWANTPDVIARRENHPSKAQKEPERFTAEQIMALLN